MLQVKYIHVTHSNPFLSTFTQFTTFTPVVKYVISSDRFHSRHLIDPEMNISAPSSCCRFSFLWLGTANCIIVSQPSGICIIIVSLALVPFSPSLEAISAVLCYSASASNFSIMSYCSFHSCNFVVIFRFIATCNPFLLSYFHLFRVF